MDEMAVFPVKGKGVLKEVAPRLKQHFPGSSIGKKNNFVLFLTTADSMSKKVMSTQIVEAKNIQNVGHVSPVFYRGRSDKSDGKMALTGEVIVQFPADYSIEQIVAIEQEYNLERVEVFSFADNTIRYRAGDAIESLDTANRLYESGKVNYSYPNWLKSPSKKALPDDPLFNDQWHLRNTGQGGGVAGEDVNVELVWDTYKGTSNQVIAIVDDGLDIEHEDLSANMIAGLSHDYIDGDSDPSPVTTNAGTPDEDQNAHGTACAGVAAARGFNTLGVTGSAPEAGLVGYRLVGASTDANEADALTRNYGTVDIYSNSWGPNDEPHLEGPGPLSEDAFTHGVTNGRGGLGSIYVWCGGNGKYDGDNSNFDGYANSRYTIAVAASTNTGVQSGYSENGANILVNAPSNGGSLDITTTDRTGADGDNQASGAAGNYIDNFGGTSSVTPLVSGIIALMLQANPDLTWRDIQHILAETADQNDPADSDWMTNGAGYHVSHKYGFGRINATNAVSAASSWISASDETSVAQTSNPNFPIPDNNSTGVTDTINITSDISVEFVEIYFTSGHSWFGDLEIVLTAPDGTESVLSQVNTQVYINTPYNNWRFGSVRHYGESSKGNWTLKVKDGTAIDTGNLEAWTLKIFGTTWPENGDVDGNGDIGLSDAVLALQVCTGLDVSVNVDAALNGDKKIGIDEVIYILQKISGL